MGAGGAGVTPCKFQVRSDKKIYDKSNLRSELCWGLGGVKIRGGAGSYLKTTSLSTGWYKTVLLDTEFIQQEMPHKK